MPATDTAIEWCDATMGPWHGCAAVSEGCANCYAERLSVDIYRHTDEDWTAENLETNLFRPQNWRTLPDRTDGPSRIFINSMSDLFLPGEFVPDEWIHEVMDVIDDHPEHAFIALTKHGAESGGFWPDEPRMQHWSREYGRWPENLWMGVSVESKWRSYRADVLRETGAETKWISFEPLVAPIERPRDVLDGIGWAVVGGESHPDAVARREMDHAWARAIRDACRDRDVPFYFKQSSGLKQGCDPVLAEVGKDPRDARWKGAPTSVYRELPPLPDALREARPGLASWEYPDGDKVVIDGGA